MQGQLQQIIQREELVNLALPLNKFMGYPMHRSHQITHDKQTINISQTHITYSKKAHKYIDIHNKQIDR